MIFHLLIIAFALVGLFIAHYIHKKKLDQEKPKLICPRRFHCADVITSKYSKILGIGIEKVGLVYYALIGLVYAYTLIADVHSLVLFGLLVLSAGAALFSVYLVLIQGFVLRKWCVWCLGSTIVSLSIFVFTILGFDMFAFFESLGIYRKAFLLIHSVGFVLGLGGATITDILFFRFLKDRVISQHEAEVMDTLSQVIWIGLGLLILSGVALYLPEMARLNESSKFMVKALVVGIILINGVLLNLIVAPKIVSISFRGKDLDHKNEPRHLRKLAHVFGAISIVSWYTAFILGSFRSLPFNFQQIFGVYLAAVLIAVIGSLIHERRFENQ